VRGDGDALPPPDWAPADGEALQHALEAAGSSELPGPSFGDYLLDLGAWLRDLVIDAVGRALPAADWSLAERVALYGAVGAAGVAALLVLGVAVRRLRQRPEPCAPVAAPVAPPLAGATADATWWGERAGAAAGEGRSARRHRGSVVVGRAAPRPAGPRPLVDDG
jgi:hypothetical protein